MQALRAQAADHIDDDPEAVAPLLAPAAALAEAHGLVEQAAWCDYVLAETGLGAGRWDDALETGLRAIAVGEQRGFSRVVYRNWFVLLPIAEARRRQDLFRRASHGGPSWLAAVETVVEAWLAAGEHDGAERALDRMRARLDLSPTTRLASAVEALLRARLRSAQRRREDAASDARRALDLLGEGGPWWRAKAIRVLHEAGGAEEALISTAAALESQLGISPGHASG